LPERVSGPLSALLMRCLAKDPAARPQSANELLRELSAAAVPIWTDEQASSWWLQRSHTAEQAQVAGMLTTLEVSMQARK
jgi:serine/threonine protein kinase